MSFTSVRPKNSLHSILAMCRVPKFLSYTNRWCKKSYGHVKCTYTFSKQENRHRQGHGHEHGNGQGHGHGH